MIENVEIATVPTAAGSVRVRTRTLLPELTGALRRVADEVLGDPAGVARLTILELAERSETSPATVTRFCRALGFRGYADLRLDIAAETGRAGPAGWEVDIGREISPRTHSTACSGRSWPPTFARSRTPRPNSLRPPSTAWLGRSSPPDASISTAWAVAPRWPRRPRRGSTASASPPRVWSEVHGGLTSAALLQPGDVAHGISHSGRTRETVEMLAEAGGSGATTVALTSYPRSPIAEVADLVLTTAVQDTRRAIAVRHSQLMVLDLMYVAVAQRTYDRTTRAFTVTARAVDGHRLGADPRRVPGDRGAGSGSGGPGVAWQGGVREPSWRF